MRRPTWNRSSAFVKDLRERLNLIYGPGGIE
jgi:hypothetical protein